jgi:hypothetical protein
MARREALVSVVQVSFILDMMELKVLLMPCMTGLSNQYDSVVFSIVPSMAQTSFILSTAKLFHGSMSSFQVGHC